MDQHLHKIPEAVKHITDIGGVGAVIVAWLDVINPLLETGILILTAIWFIYRIRALREARQADD